MLTASAVSAAHWAPGAVIRVWVDPMRAPSGGETLVERAMQTRTAAAGGRVRPAAGPGQEEGGTRPRERAPIRVASFARYGRYGMTQARPDPATGLLVEAEVVVAADPAGDALDRQIVVYLTALHELGHAIGLSHSADANDIMFVFRLPGDGERFFGAHRQRLRSFDDVGSTRASGLSAEDVRL